MHKSLEYSNHLTNVLTVGSDKKLYNSTSQTYSAQIISTSDYYPFGLAMYGRKNDSEKYRFGFNGKENDTEYGSSQLVQDYGFRIYNPSIGRFLSVDPLERDYPELTVYQFASNRPIDGIDLDGLECLDVDIIRPKENGKPGLTNVYIRMEYTVVNSGSGKVTENLDPAVFRTKYRMGNVALFSYNVPSSTEAPKFLEGEYEVWANKAYYSRKAEVRLKFATKLANAGVDYNILKVSYDYSLIYRNNETVGSALAWIEEDTKGRGMISEPMSKLDLAIALGMEDGKKTAEGIEVGYIRLNTLSRKSFRDPTTGGIATNSSVFGSDVNMAILNPNTSMTLSATLRAVHEAGHNAAAEHVHTTKGYGKTDPGLSSNSNPEPTRSNTKNIISDESNRETIYE